MIGLSQTTRRDAMAEATAIARVGELGVYATSIAQEPRGNDGECAEHQQARTTKYYRRRGQAMRCDGMRKARIGVDRERQAL